MSTHPSKKAKLDDLPLCPYGIPFLFFWSFIFVLLFLGSKCYRKNPAHFKEFSHTDPTPTATIPQVTTTGLLRTDLFLLKLY